MTAAELLEYPAARLFVERLSTRGVAPDIAELDVPTIAAICRRLDGIALALELVAGRVDTFGITGIASLLDSDLALHLSGKRTSIPRHRTLSATIDWSYRLLAENERVVLRRLSVFTGPFSLEAARRVVIDANAAGCERPSRGILCASGKIVDNGGRERFRSALSSARHHARAAASSLDRKWRGPRNRRSPRQLLLRSHRKALFPNRTHRQSMTLIGRKPFRTSGQHSNSRFLRKKRLSTNSGSLRALPACSSICPC